MKLLKESINEVLIFHFGRKRWANVYIEEYSTIWKIACKFYGFELPCAVDWRYKKKEYKTIESVIEAFKHDIEKRFN